MAEKKSTAERGLFKEQIHEALFKSNDIRELLLGDTTGLSQFEIFNRFKDHVKSHLFIDDTITEAESFIFYDVAMPKLGAQIKQCTVVMYLVCHRDILNDYRKEGYYGNRMDVLSQMVEDILINDTEVAHSFGIGRLLLTSIDIYNSMNVYGNILTFQCPDFR